MSSGGIGNAVSSVLSFTILGKLFETKAPKPTTQRIGELAQQTAKEGEPRPIVWGRVRPISGNIMHSSTPRIVRREVKGQSSGGKGGKKKQPKQYEERVFRTYAIRICEGPITAIMRVWRNNKLVYDARGNEWGRKNNSVFTKRARFYLGNWTQMPDPTLESQWGAGNVPAYRGTCYMVVPDEDLTELGGAIPQYIYEVERAEGSYVTSRPYAVEESEPLDGHISAQRLRDPFIRSDQLDQLDGGISLEAMDFSSLLKEYELSENIDGSIDVTSMVFRQSKKISDNGVDSCDGGIQVQGLRVRVGKIVYTDPAWPESCDGNISVQGMSHNAS